MKRRWAALILLMATPLAQAQSCGMAPVQVQILGSGGPELTDARAAAAILVWVNGKPRILVDTGPGAAIRFVQAGANITDVDAILFTHLHIGRTADLPALVQLPSSPARTRPLPIYGPTGSRSMPSTVSFVRTLFDPARGAWRHLGDFLSPLSRTAYKLEPHDLRPPKLGVPRENRDEILSVFATNEVRVTAVPLTYGDTPALAWRVETLGKRLVVSGETSTDGDALERIAHGADLLAVPHGALEEADAGKRAPALAPTAIGRLARTAEIKQLVLAPRTRITLGREEESAAAIRRHYTGAIVFANDLDCLTP
jgi:ribonuclease BN (tRNA processing enzyme)